VRITASEIIGAEVLPPILTRLHEAQPSDLAQLAAVRAGFGIGVCQVGLARRSADLVRVMAKSFLFKLEVWIVMHSGLRSSARCRVVADALAAGLTVYCAGS
jgi:DNA-binding transcriptional LysR family regulator